MLDFEQCWAALETTRRRRGWPVLLRCPHDRGLLPAGLRLAPAAAQERRVLRDDAEAEAAGFRPCKRCRPTEGPRPRATSPRSSAPAR